ncbi:hypothetical protein SAY87_000310 [Trapa incisa]|uniref:Uncharacterized protein n=1 Tax=Trapa incisa TaxID=236973 RepID=A0AAN7GIC0_9MYRT|nr:hypothetical protein SAY87_000310 [Trapa incisa]
MRRGHVVSETGCAGLGDQKRLHVADFLCFAPPQGQRSIKASILPLVRSFTFRLQQAIQHDREIEIGNGKQEDVLMLKKSGKTQNREVQIFFVNFMVTIIGLVLSFLTLAAASPTASVVDLLLPSEDHCSVKLCSRYQISAIMAFMSWFFSLASSLFNLWLLPSS